MEKLDKIIERRQYCVNVHKFTDRQGKKEMKFKRYYSRLDLAKKWKFKNSAGFL